MISIADECVLFFDLETISWLFEGQGDFQFEVYRMMRKETKWLLKYLAYSNPKCLTGKTGKDFTLKTMSSGFSTLWTSC